MTFLFWKYSEKPVNYTANCSLMISAISTISFLLGNKNIQIRIWTLIVMTTTEALKHLGYPYFID